MPRPIGKATYSFPHQSRCGRGEALIARRRAVHQRSKRQAPVGSVVGKRVGRDSVQVGSVRETVTSREEVRPMNARTMWVLPLVFTVRRLI